VEITDVEFSLARTPVLCPQRCF